MKLEEQFKRWLDTDPTHNKSKPSVREWQCVHIAENFAIEFSEWMAKEYWLNSSDKYSEADTMGDMIKAFKEEKGY